MKLLAYARNRKGVALAGLGHDDLATEEFQQSIELQPGNAWVYFNRAQFHELKQDVSAAIADYRFALENKDPPLRPPKHARTAGRLRELAKQ